MKKTLKILLVRFSSIGDIVLTTPVIRCLKLQLDAEIHFITKLQYHPILVNNKYLDHIYTINRSINEIYHLLEKEEYDYVIDLHNNLRSHSLRRLKSQYLKVIKSNFKRFLFIKWGINIFKSMHVVDRYMNSLKLLGVQNDSKGIDYFLGSNIKVEFNIDQKFITWCVGASSILKKLSSIQILESCNNLQIPVVFLGDQGDHNLAEEVIKKSSNKNLYNFCGSLSIDQSAFLIKHSSLVLTNDTGLMHIASAFQKIIISFWGCTKPILGFSPYMTDKRSIQIISDLSLRPCSRHGSYCRHQSLGCVKEIDSVKISNSIKKLLF